MRARVRVVPVVRVSSVVARCSYDNRSAQLSDFSVMYVTCRTALTPNKTKDTSQTHNVIQDVLNQHTRLLFRGSDRHFKLFVFIVLHVLKAVVQKI